MSKFLVNKGANPGERDGDDQCCLALATDNSENRKQKVVLILEAGSNRETPLWTLEDKAAAFIAAFIDLDTAKVLAIHGKEIFQHQNDIFTILGRCLDSDEEEVVVEFLKLGANPFRHKGNSRNFNGLLWQHALTTHSSGLVRRNSMTICRILVASSRF